MYVDIQGCKVESDILSVGMHGVRTSEGWGKLHGSRAGFGYNPVGIR